VIFEQVKKYSEKFLFALPNCFWLLRAM